MGRRIGQVIIGLVLFAAFFIAVFGTAVHLLWNGLMPQLFGLPHLGFWQGVGLLTLSWLLFGGWRGMPFRGRHRGWRHHRDHRARWESLTPEERVELKRRMRGCRRGPWEEPEEEARPAAGASAPSAPRIDARHSS